MKPLLYHEAHAFICWPSLRKHPAPFTYRHFPIPTPITTTSHLRLVSDPHKLKKKFPRRSSKWGQTHSLKRSYHAFVRSFVPALASLCPTLLRFWRAFNLSQKARVASSLVTSKFFFQNFGRNKKKLHRRKHKSEIRSNARSLQASMLRSVI